jgi:hypothetical protein
MASRYSRIEFNGETYSWPRKRSTRGWWLTPRPNTKRSSKVAFNVRAAFTTATASRPQMLVMPEAIVSDVEADKSNVALVSDSRPQDSGNHRAENPRASISAATPP